MADRQDAWRKTLEARFEFGRLLGEGASARVFAATDRRDGRQVAIKILRTGLTDADASVRFAREIDVVRSLDHPHILRLLDAGEADGVPWFAMPLAEGPTLRARLAAEPQLPLDDARRIVDAVASALDYAHAHGVLHRDIKPENIILTADGAMVADFGVAGAFGDAASVRITATGLTVGTPLYMSTEQASAERSLDARSDVYALGCVTYEMLTGEPPFHGATAQAVRARHALEAVPDVRIVRPGLPASVNDALHLALAKSPADRPASAGAFARRFASDVPLTPPARVLWRSPRVRWASVGVLAVLAVVAVVARRAPSRVGDAAARRWVLVADFASAPDDRAMAAAVRELAIAELSQSALFSIVPSDQVMTARRNAGMPDSVPIDAARARELAMRSSVRVVVEGGVHKLGADRWSLTVRAVNAEDGATLLSSSASAADQGDALVATVGKLVRGVRERLGEHADALAATRALQNVSTPSFAAFRLYQDALALMRTADYDGAVHLLHRAVALDSGFASAWSLLANNFVTTHRADSALWAFGRAQAHPERLSDADRDRLAGDVAFHVDRDYAAAVQAYERYLAQRPVSLGGLNNRAIFLSALGRHEEALATFRRASTIDPLVVGPRKIELLNVASELIVLGRADSARLVARALTGAHAQYMRLLLLNVAGQWDSLRVAARAVLDDPTASRFAKFPAVLHEAGALDAVGDTAAATARLVAALATASGSDLRWLVHARLLRDAAREQRPDWPLPAAVHADTSAGARLLRGVYAAQRGDTLAARRELDWLERLPVRAAREIGSGGVYLAAWLDLAAGRAADAAARLREPASRGEHDPFSVDRTSGVALSLLKSRALAAAGQPEAARVALERARAAEGIPPSHYPLRGFVAAHVGVASAVGVRARVTRP